MHKNYKYIDLNYLNTISTDIEFQKKIIFMFQKEITIAGTDMKNALQNKDFNRLREVAHKVKSNVSVMGMKKQSDDMKRLETDIKSGLHEETYQERVDLFIYECNEALTEIDEILKSM
jgi:HPt (histidine-containing phosphotransfer) domain-containing protein